jgi:hypothetical protein
MRHLPLPATQPEPQLAGPRKFGLVFTRAHRDGDIFFLWLAAIQAFERKEDLTGLAPRHSFVGTQLIEGGSG